MFCKHFNHDIEKLVDDRHTEYKYSTDLRQWLQQLCEILQCSYHMPKQRVLHRWMSVLDALEPSVSYLILSPCYWSWLHSKDKPDYQEIINEILKPLSTKEKAIIARIIQQCKVKKLTSDGKARKLRINRSPILQTTPNPCVHPSVLICSPSVQIIYPQV